MKKLNEIMQELGFEKGGSVSVQKAFIKNLIKQAAHADKVKSIYPDQGPQKNLEKPVSKGNKSATYMAHYRKQPSEQLSFDLQNCGSIKTQKKPKYQAG